METKLNSEKIGIKNLLAYKGYITCLTASFISKIGDSIDVIAYGWMVYMLTGSKVLLGTIFAVNAIPKIIFSPFIGPLIDRFVKKRIVVITTIGRGIIVSLTAFLFLANTLKPWYLFVFTFFNATLETIGMPASTALLPMLLPKNLFQTATSFSNSTSKTAELIGLALTATIIATLGISGAMVIDGVTFFISALLIALIKVEGDTRSSSEFTFNAYFTDLREGLSFIKNNKLILISIILFAVVNFSVSPLNVLEPAFVKDVLKSGPEFQSVLGICMTIGVILGGLALAQYGSKFKVSSLVILGFFIFGINYSLLIIPNNLVSNLTISRIISAAVYALLGLVIPIATSPISSYIVSNTPREMIGRVASVLNMVCLCAVPLGSCITGVLCEYVQMQIMFFVMGMIISLVAMLLLFNKNFRKA